MNYSFGELYIFLGILCSFLTFLYLGYMEYKTKVLKNLIIRNIKIDGIHSSVLLILSISVILLLLLSFVIFIYPTYLFLIPAYSYVNHLKRTEVDNKDSEDDIR